MIQVPSPAPMFSDDAKDFAYISTAATGIGAVVSRVIVWARRKRQEHKARKTEVLKQLEALCAGQKDIYIKLEQMDESRDKASAMNASAFVEVGRKLGDITADVRLSVSASATALDGIIQIGKGANIPVNGAVIRLWDKLQDRIEEGVGGPHPAR